ncbi:hypothetical protein BJX61DRAFT_545262 [Aspergillus egyptiacus]|nr:hypothetical protein BJX61DRAFT_545262 [Aspergillus egyptiacus]
MSNFPHGKMFPFRRKRTPRDERQPQGSSASPPSPNSPPPFPTSSSPSSTAFNTVDWSRGEVENQGTSTDLDRKPSLARRLVAGSAFKLPPRNPPLPTDRRKDPHGLSVVYEPETTRSLDIIFVHGLGGTSRATWARDRDPQYFWPGKWLPFEPGIRMARILSFGYDASWNSTGPTPIVGIADFARDLLYCMKFGKDDNLEELELGKRPIIFIVHSMGGLVVKQAYLLGKDDDQYSDIVAAISAILFLATPHRGSNLADVLNRILAVSFNYSPKLYISELSTGSQTVAYLNDQFRHFADKFDILSFYETLQTSVGPKKMMIVEKESATLGYPKEITKALIADHHTVCKFHSTQDSNYISVRNALKTLVSSIRSAGQSLFGDQEKTQIEQLQALLAVSESYQDDLEFFHSRWTPGTCEWILSNPCFKNWLDESDDSVRLLWLYALPASGKSILSSFITKHLQAESLCVYYFFRFGDESKRSLSTCLRCIAFQIAQQLPAFRRALKNMPSPTKTLEKTDSKIIWERIFVRILFKMKLATTIYLVIDALDESDHPQLLVELFQRLSHTPCRIKVLLISREAAVLTEGFDYLATQLPVARLPLESSRRDIRLFVETKIKILRAAPEFKSRLVDKLVTGANGNFLWASLVIREVMKCNTEKDVDETLRGIPSGMEKLYQRMERTIIENTRPKDRQLGHRILMWATCSRRPLALSELAQALESEFSVILDLSLVINRVCGQFVVVDSDRLVMVHQTARDHIVGTDSELRVDESEGHEMLLTKCLTVLEKHHHIRGQDIQYGEFYHYAMTSWAYHLDKISPDSDDSLLRLAHFLKGNYVLDWIVAIAQTRRLKVLVQSAKSMNLFVRRKRGRYAATNPMVHRLQELDLVESWATDLLKLVGKFGIHLTECPSSIYQQIPPFCPKNSMIYRQFEQYSPRPHSLSVDGLSRATWDNGLAKISLQSAHHGQIIVCGGAHFAVLTGGGVITLYNSTTFEISCVFRHAEEVSVMVFSRRSDLLVTYGYRSTKVWSVKSGQMLHQIQNPFGSRALTVTFASEDTQLMIGSNDRLLRVAHLKEENPAWTTLYSNLLTEDTDFGRRVHNVPFRMAFNPDATCIAVAYRGLPMCVWSLETATLVGRCMRDPKYVGNSWTVVDQMVWHPKSKEILGLYMGGQVFRWNPYKNSQQELEAEGSILACSQEGKFFTVGDSQGNIKVYSFNHFALIYTLSCEHMISGLCFSPDSKRLYDLRGPWCNVWEPNCLLAGEESGEDSDLGSEAASIPTAMVSEASEEVRAQITAIAIQFRGRYHAIGDESGVVSVVDSSGSEHVASELWRSPLELPIAHLDWSSDGNYLACVEIAGRVVVKEIRQGSGWTVRPAFEARLNVSSEGIQQVLLSGKGTIVLVKNGHSVTVQPVKPISGSSEPAVTITSPDTKWVNHPTDPKLLLAFSPTQVGVYKWDDITKVAVVDLASPPIILLHSSDTVVNDNKTDTKIQRICHTSSGSDLLIHSTVSSNGRKQAVTSLLPLTSLNPSPTTSSTTITPFVIPAEIQDQIEIPLGVLSRQRLVFLDRNYWMCSWVLSPNYSPEHVHRHYFLPKYWLNAECLEQCALLPDGVFLMPNNGELAVVRGTGLSHG